MATDLLTAASQGPEVLAKALATLPPDEWESHWMNLEATIVRSAGYTFEGFMAFARLMMYQPGTGRIVEPALHHQNWVKACFENDRIVILAPPESAKTTILSVLFTAFTVGHKPWTQNFVVSVSDDQAEKIVGMIAGYIADHPCWKMCFPEVVPDKKQGWGDKSGYFVKRRGNYGAWLQERGTNKDPTLLGTGYSNRSIYGKRVDGIFVVDDIMDETNARSEAELDYTKSQFRRVIASRVTATAKLILVGTPWREDDVYAEAIASGLYSVHVTPCMDKEETVSYWPEVWPLERLRLKRIEVQEQSFQLMYMMNLSAAKGTILKEDWLHPYFLSVNINPSWPCYYGIDFAITSSDMAIKRRGQQRSYFALAKGRQAPFNIVLTDGIRQQVALGEAIELIRNHASNDNPQRIKIETWGGGEVFIQQLYRELPGLPLDSYKDDSDKTPRFLKMARHFEFSRIRISDAETPFLQTFKNEWIGYPHYPTNDCLDAVCALIDGMGFLVYSGQELAAQIGKPAQSGPKTDMQRRLFMPKSRFAPR